MTRPSINVNDRIASERQYHERYYDNFKVQQDVSFDLATRSQRKPQNLVWVYYDTITNHFGGDLRNKKILVMGCGGGLVALNLAKSGAEVDAFDLSDKAVWLCKQRAEKFALENVKFFVASCEEAQLAAGTYDAVVGEMILHHVDIPTTIAKTREWLKPSGLGAFMEWKVYAGLDSVRSLPIFERLFPPGGVGGYATEYERKLSAADFRVIRDTFPGTRLEFRYCLSGKIDYFSPALGHRVERLDYWLLRHFPVIRPFTDAVIISFRK
jgi:SAM-dependent methyltransferase